MSTSVWKELFILGRVQRQYTVVYKYIVRILYIVHCKYTVWCASMKSVWKELFILGRVQRSPPRQSGQGQLYHSWINVAPVARKHCWKLLKIYLQ